MRFLKSDRGFTLVEMIGAIAILAIILSVVLFNMQAAKEKARDTERVSDFQQIQLAVRGYKDLYSTSTLPAAVDGELYSGSDLESKISLYLPHVIEDPINSDEFQYYYDSSHDCNGTIYSVAIALTMERSNGNYVEKCDATPEDLGGGVVPTASSYIVIF